VLLNKEADRTLSHSSLKMQITFVRHLLVRVVTKVSYSGI